MTSKVFINLPVKNLEKSTHFFQDLGFNINPRFTDEMAACIVLNETTFVLLLIEEYFKTFIDNEICDTNLATEVTIALATVSIEEVKRTVSKALSIGGRQYAMPQDYGWMYQHSFLDLDGHRWEVAYVDEEQLPSDK